MGKASTEANDDLVINQVEDVTSKQKFSIFCGSYEGAIIGLAGDLSKMELKYAFKPSTNSLKCMDVCGKYLVVGGFDEYLRIYDLKRQREVGILDSHIGTITSIHSHGSIVISCAEDGLIKAWKMKEFGLLHTLKEHKDTVNDIAVHSSGKILVSVSKDQRLIIWNLISATKVYVLNLKYNAYKVQITEKYVITMSDYSLHVINLDTNKEVCELKCDQKQEYVQVSLNDFTVFGENYVVVGDNNGFIFIFDITTKKSISFRAHDSRVKKLQIANIDGLDIIITISTNGEIHLFDALVILHDITEISESQVLENLKPIYKVATLNRLTSLCIYMDVAEDKKKDENILSPEEQQAAEEERVKAEKLRKQKEAEKARNQKNQKKVKITIEGEEKDGQKTFIIDQNQLAKNKIKKLKKKQKISDKLKAAAAVGSSGANTNQLSKPAKQQQYQQQQKQSNKGANQGQNKPGKKTASAAVVAAPEKQKKIKKSVSFK